MHGLEEAGASQVRQPSSVIAIGLVGRKRLERLVRLPAFDADHGEAELAQAMEQDRRHASGLEYDPTTARRFRQLVRDRLCGRRRLALVDNSALAIQNADARLVHRDIEASKIVHERSPLPNQGRSYRRFRKSPAHYPMLKRSDFRFD